MIEVTPLIISDWAWARRESSMGLLMSMASLRSPAASSMVRLSFTWKSWPRLRERAATWTMAPVSSLSSTAPRPGLRKP